MYRFNIAMCFITDYEFFHGLHSDIPDDNMCRELIGPNEEFARENKLLELTATVDCRRLSRWCVIL
jgi:hypothetical protein